EAFQLLRAVRRIQVAWRDNDEQDSALLNPVCDLVVKIIAAVELLHVAPDARLAPELDAEALAQQFVEAIHPALALPAAVVAVAVTDEQVVLECRHRIDLASREETAESRRAVAWRGSWCSL